MTGVSQQVNTHVLDCNDAGLLGLAWWAHSEVLILKSHPAREKSSNISFENTLPETLYGSFRVNSRVQRCAI